MITVQLRQVTAKVLRSYGIILRQAWMSFLLFRRSANSERYTSRRQKSIISTVFHTPSRNPIFSPIIPSTHVATARISDLSSLNNGALPDLLHYTIHYKQVSRDIGLGLSTVLHGHTRWFEDRVLFQKKYSPFTTNIIAHHYTKA